MPPPLSLADRRPATQPQKSVDSKGNKDEGVQKSSLQFSKSTHHRDRKPGSWWFVLGGVAVSITSYDLAPPPNTAPAGQEVMMAATEGFEGPGK